MKETEINPLKSIYEGVPTTTFRMPSGFDISIRETNGDDDDVLSKYKDSMEGNSGHKLISGIIMDNSLHRGEPTTASEVMGWKLKDKYYTLLKSRIFSLGPIMLFTHKFADGTEEQFEEDLSMYDWDLTKPLPEQFITEAGVRKLNPLYFKYRISRASAESERSIILSSGKRIKYEYISGLGERILLDKNRDDMSKNDELRARNLKLDMGGGSFQTMESFKLFNSKEMSEIRADIEKNDQEWKCITELQNPKDGSIEIISLITIPDFFFPLQVQS